MVGLSEELKKSLNEPIINYSLFIKTQIIEDVDGLAVSSYRMDKHDLNKNNEDLSSMKKETISNNSRVFKKKMH